MLSILGYIGAGGAILQPGTGEGRCRCQPVPGMSRSHLPTCFSSCSGLYNIMRHLLRMIIYRDLKPENAAVSDLSLLHHAIALLCSRGAFLPGVVVFWFPQGRTANVQGGLLDFQMNFMTLGAGSAYPPMI